MAAARLADLRHFYALLDIQSERLGGPRSLGTTNARLSWPQRGVYFFLEAGEQRSDSGSGLRVVRVGTHALLPGAQTTLWRRLAQHRGVVRHGGGNHRASIFRLLIGTALMEREGTRVPSWGRAGEVPPDRVAEHALEQRVSAVIGAMPVVWIAVDDSPGPASLRADLERNAIALLSNAIQPPLDAPSANWLGHFCDRALVRRSGLWNSNHVEDAYDPGFLDRLEHCIDRTPFTP